MENNFLKLVIKLRKPLSRYRFWIVNFGSAPFRCSYKAHLFLQQINDQCVQIQPPVVFAWCYVPLDTQFCAPSGPPAHIRCCQHFGMEFTQCHFLDPCSEPQGATLLLWAEGADSCIILLLHLFWRFLFSSASSVAILMPRQKMEMEWFNSNARVFYNL